MQRSSLLHDSDSDSDPFQLSSNQAFQYGSGSGAAVAQGGQESQRLAELDQENTDVLFQQQQEALMAAGDDIDPMLLACQGGGAFMAEQLANQEWGSPSTDGGDSPDRKMSAIADVKQPSVLVKDGGDGSEDDAALMSFLMNFHDPLADDPYDASKEDEDVVNYDVADFFSEEIGPREGMPASNVSTGSSVVEIISSKVSRGCTRLTDMLTGVGKRPPVTREISSSEAKSRPGAPPVGTKKKRGPILPKPSQEEQVLHYDVFKTKLREADDKHKQYFGKSRGPIISLLENTFAPSNLKWAELHKMGLGKCGVPLHRNGVSIEGDTLPADDNKFNANASATGWRAIGDAAPYTGYRKSRHIFPYQRQPSRQSDFLGINCR
jgi:hypothetical protein